MRSRMIFSRRIKPMRKAFPPARNGADAAVGQMSMSSTRMLPVRSYFSLKITNDLHHVFQVKVKMFSLNSFLKPSLMFSFMRPTEERS